MSTLKFERKNQLFKLLKYEQPKIGTAHFSFYKDIDIDEDPYSSKFEDELPVLLSDFLIEAQENSYTPYFKAYVEEVLAEAEKIKTELIEGEAQVYFLTLRLLEIKDVPNESAWMVVQSLPHNKKSRTNVRSIERMIRTQLTTCKNVLTEFNKLQMRIDGGTNPVADAQQPYTRLFAPAKVDSKLNKRDLVSLFWLLYQANILKFNDKAHLINFLESNFRYTKAQQYNDLTHVKSELSRIYPDSFEEAQEKILRELEIYIEELKTNILQSLKNEKFRSPGTEK